MLWLLWPQSLFCLTEVLLVMLDVKNPHVQYARQTFQKVSLSDWKNSFLELVMRYPDSYVTIRWDGIFRILSLSVLRQTLTSASIPLWAMLSSKASQWGLQALSNMLCHHLLPLVVLRHQLLPFSWLSFLQSCWSPWWSRNLPVSSRGFLCLLSLCLRGACHLLMCFTAHASFPRLLQRQALRRLNSATLGKMVLLSYFSTSCALNHDFLLIFYSYHIYIKHISVQIYLFVIFVSK